MAEIGPGAGGDWFDFWPPLAGLQARVRQDSDAIEFVFVDNRQFTYQVWHEDVDVYKAIQLGFQSNATGDIVFGTHENGPQALTSNIDENVIGKRRFETQEG